jgi:hypothetical protein
MTSTYIHAAATPSNRRALKKFSRARMRPAKSSASSRIGTATCRQRMTQTYIWDR